jgi:hypothetical protein
VWAIGTESGAKEGVVRQDASGSAVIYGMLLGVGGGGKKRHLCVLGIHSAMNGGTQVVSTSSEDRCSKAARAEQPRLSLKIRVERINQRSEVEPRGD